ncbi:GMC family oxidoreductase [Ruegeria atlantica]|uniref:GMC family oxidoreductase n=1 Tax=Ruegeria atlantica TaxID=81569 RepID=UPI00147FFC4A|nr:GMC family oxidoreductase [Ruegeria atlantica]
MATQFDLDDDSVVVIIGSGAGGGTLANELAQKGISSVVLEAGGVFEFDDIENDEWGMFLKLTDFDKRYSGGGWHGAQNHPTLPNWLVKGLGGSTVHWAGVSLRFYEHEFKMRTVNGAIQNANVEDWPITLEELEPYYDRAEIKMGVTGKATGMPHLPWNNDFRVLAEGARRVGYTKIQSGPMAINSEDYDGRPACQQIGFCMQGCKIGAKWSTDITEIPAAVETGKCEVRTNCMVLKIEHDDTGKATGVVYADKDGNHHVQKARIVAVAGNSIETPRLLLNSASPMFPDGMANSSGQVGKNYMVHVNGGVYSEMPERVHIHRGTQVAGIVADEVPNNPDRGFTGGYHLEKLTLGLPVMSLFLKRGNGAWGKDLAEALEKYDYLSGVYIVGEDLAQEQNRITLHDTEKDQHGLPVPIVNRTPHNNDERMLKHAYGVMDKIHDAVGAKVTHHLAKYPASHNMGTARMHEDPDKGVVNKWGQAHDVPNLFISDGSVFTSSGAANPTLTIVALVIRQAEYIAQEMNAQNI